MTNDNGPTAQDPDDADGRWVPLLESDFLTPEALIAGEVQLTLDEGPAVPWVQLTPAITWDVQDLPGQRVRRVCPEGSLVITGLRVVSAVGPTGRVFVTTEAEWHAERDPRKDVPWHSPRQGRRFAVSVESLVVETLTEAPEGWPENREEPWWHFATRWERCNATRGVAGPREPVPARHAGPLVGQRVFVTGIPHGEQPLIAASEPWRTDDGALVVTVLPEAQWHLKGQAHDIPWKNTYYVGIESLWVVT